MYKKVGESKGLRMAWIWFYLFPHFSQTKCSSGLDTNRGFSTRFLFSNPEKMEETKHNKYKRQVHMDKNSFWDIYLLRSERFQRSLWKMQDDDDGSSDKPDIIIQIMNFIEGVLCTRHHAKCFTSIVSFNPYGHSMIYLVISERWEKVLTHSIVFG